MTGPPDRGDRAAGSASVVDLAFAAAVLLVPLLAGGHLLNGDGDPARHLVTGRHILTHGPTFADPFSFTRAGEPFIAYEWGSQALFAVAHGLAGLPGLVVLAGLMLAAALALVVRYVRGGGDPWLAFVTGAIAAVVSSGHWLARPHLFSFLGLALLLRWLESDRRVVWVLPLFALWANLHPGFLYGLIMLAAWSAGAVLEDLRDARPLRAVAARRGLPMVAAAAATLLNPFGWTLHAHSLGLLGSETAGAVREFMPLVVTSAYGLLVLAIVGIVVVGLAASREWVGWPVLLVFGAGVVGALAVRRNAPMLAFFALPVVARALAPTVARLPQWAFGRMREEFRRADTPGWRFGAIATVILVGLVAVDAGLAGVRVLPTEFSKDVFPVAAVRHAREAGLDGRLLSEYGWGGYVLYAWPDQRVFVDSFADHYGDALVADYLRMRHASRGWAPTLEEHDLSLVLLPPDAPLVGELRGAGSWRVAYEDEVAVLLTRAPTAEPGA